MKLLEKPQHGTLTPTQVDTVIRQNRFRPNDPCIGKPGNGFLVEYQSEADYRGPDLFKIEATYGKRRRRVIDDYKIMVK